jgi:hypothetical protein
MLAVSPVTRRILKGRARHLMGAPKASVNKPSTSVSDLDEQGRGEVNLKKAVVSGVVRASLVASAVVGLSTVFTGFAGRCVYAALIGLALSGYGLKSKSLSPDGAFAAFFVGSLTIFAGANYGAALVCFFLSCSRLTKEGAKRKMLLEEGYKIGGQRSAGQVAANGLVPTLLAVAFAYFSATNPSNLAVSRALACAFVGYYSCCAGDTWCYSFTKHYW